MEASERQRDTAAGILRAAGLTPRVLVSEELYATVLTGTRGTPKNATPQVTRPAAAPNGPVQD